MKDYYKILEVERGCSAAEIKKSYRRLARIHHPDANQNSEESTKRFMEISEAYEVLGSEEKRAEYENLLQGRRTENKKARPNTSNANKAYNFDPRNFGDMFSNFFDVGSEKTKSDGEIKNKVNNMFQNYFTGGRK